tara:strand:+ start:122 stop:1300 length:1179 start_codon:yes stop_codon:yes gene_type:complete
MNKIYLIFKFLIIRGYSNKYNWSFLFPFIGAIIGCIIVILTLSIMEGMENEIFTKLKKISYPSKILNIEEEDYLFIDSILTIHNINHNVGLETELLLIKDNNFKSVNVHGLNNINDFNKMVLKSEINQYVHYENTMGKIYLGGELANRLNVLLGDKIIIADLNQFNFFTGLPKMKKVVVHGIYKTNLLDYDMTHIYMHTSVLKKITNNNKFSIFIDEYLSNEILDILINKFPLIKYEKWDEKYLTFISAMKLEKLTYSIIGYLIIFISSFTLMSMMSLSVMQKVPQIGILKVIGVKKIQIISIFIIQAIITSLLSSSIAIIFSLFFIHLNNNLNLISKIFNNSIPFNFMLVVNNDYLYFVMITTIFIMVASGIYPSIKASKLDPVKSITFNK